MARLNNRPKTAPVFTQEGAPAYRHASIIQQLRRSVLSCLLWEKEFYEDGKDISARIKELAAQVPPVQLAQLAVETRSVFHLRHVPLLLLSVLVRTGAGRDDKLVETAIQNTIQRPDELAELLAVFWGSTDRRGPNGKMPVPHSLARGLSRAFMKFDEYALAKYDRDNGIKMRDVMRIIRPKPTSEEQSALYKKVVERTLETPDTWEVALSAGADKKETFTRLIKEGQLGYLALLRNLRNMAEAGVDSELVKQAILARKGGAHRVLPFRYVAAARVVPQYERELDTALLAAISEMEPLEGRTGVLADVSGSMDAKLSARSDMTRMDAAATLAAIIPGDLRVFTFSNNTKEVPPRRGMAGVDAIVRSQPHGGTYLGAAVRHMNTLDFDRLIVITDEQSHDPVPDPKAEHAYMINVASNKHGIGYGKWIHLDGFSEGILRYIEVSER